MAMAATRSKQLLQQAIQANLAIQNTLTSQAAQVEAQLKELDELTEAVDKVEVTEEAPDDTLGREFQIPGSKRASGPIPSFELLFPVSPFFKEASQRAHYLRWTNVHPIKGKEAEVLADAVKKENMRLEAYRARDTPAAPPIDIVNNVEGINWSIVAEKVSDQSNTKRTPDECRIQWVGNLHPKVNHGEWTSEELNKLHDLTANELAAGGKINWTRVAKDLGTNRIPIECMNKATTRPRHHWDTLNDQKLREAVQMFGTNNWNLVACHVSPYVTTSQCQTRYVRSVDPGIKRGSWSLEEDERLRKAVAAFGNSWIDVASVLPGRTNEQCRERWGEISANAGGKGNWTAEEDEKLLDLGKELGNKWKAISIKLDSGRSGPHCRLRHDRLIRMRARQAEEPGVATTPAAGQSRLSPPVAPAGMGSTKVTVPVTVSTESEPRQGRSKAVEPSMEEDAPEVLQDTTSVQPAQPQESSENVIPSKSRPRPRPRPRPTTQGEGRAVEICNTSSRDIEACSGGPVGQSAADGSSVLPPHPERGYPEIQVPHGQTQPQAEGPYTQPNISTPPVPGPSPTVPASLEEPRIADQGQTEAQNRLGEGQVPSDSTTIGTSARRRKRKRAVGESDADSGVPEGRVETAQITEIEGVQQQQMRRRSTRKKRKVGEVETDDLMPDDDVQEDEGRSTGGITDKNKLTRGRGKGTSGGRGGRRGGRGRGRRDNVPGSTVVDADVEQERRGRGI